MPRLTDGEDERVVPALSEHGERLAELAEEGRRLELAYLVSSNGSAASVNAISDLVADINGSADTPRVVAARLRTTWLVTHLQARTPLDVLMGAAGSTSVGRLAELMVYIDVFDEDEGRRILTQADQWRTGGGG